MSVSEGRFSEEGALSAKVQDRMEANGAARPAHTHTQPNHPPLTYDRDFDRGTDSQEGGGRLSGAQNVVIYDNDRIALHAFAYHPYRKYWPESF